MAIGIFDSGIGGITVLKEVQKRFPSKKIIYFGDTKRVPYGNKKKEDLIKFSEEIVSFLIKKGANIIIDACNTTCALALPYLQKKFNIPIIGILKPGANAAVNITKGIIGIIATEATIKSKCYENEIRKKSSKIKIVSVSCPKLVDFIEKGDIESIYLKNTLKKYLEPIFKNKCDTLILGCTHYPFLMKTIKILNYNFINIINPAEYIDEFFKKNKLYNSNSNDCYISSDSIYFKKNLLKFHPYHKFKKIYIKDPIKKFK